MLEASGGPRLYGVPLGADFPAVLLAGMERRLAGAAPEAWAQVRVIVNTRRMQRRLRGLFAEGPSRLLPRIELLTELADDPSLGLGQPVPPLRRRLTIARMVRALLDRMPGLAPRSAAFDLADSLSDLLDEMRMEGVPLSDLLDLDVGDMAEHWQRSLAFIKIVGEYERDAEAGTVDAAQRQRSAVEATIAGWSERPPPGPVIVAGSTGSRGPTRTLMLAAAGLPQGAVVLPGFDFAMPAAVWSRLSAEDGSEDHPQTRFATLAADLGVDPRDVPAWDGPPRSTDRSLLVSLALRPAPVTDQWLTDGARLPHLPGATEGVSLLEARDPRAEAQAIAMRLRQALADGQRAALVTPDRNLGRRVAAALDRWRIIPDDSAGRPLSLTAPGRFLRQVAGLMGGPPDAETLLALLNHPLCHAGGDRGAHQLRTRELELWLRRKGSPLRDVSLLREWCARRREPGATEWVDWLAGVLDVLAAAAEASAGTLLEAHLAAAETLAQGASAGPGILWDEPAGRAAFDVCMSLKDEAPSGGVLDVAAYRALIDTLFETTEVRDTVATHGDVMIWGTLEARVQGADLVILGGLNEGSWPAHAKPDPWLNRAMRSRVGLLLPERAIGLSAHDFQQAIAAPEVILTRSRRDGESETVMSRWLNRLVNLMAGLPDRGGPEALAAMRARGDAILAQVAATEDVRDATPKARRPAPCPPVSARPSRLGVTEISTLVRDPYAIYARHVLRLAPLDPLRPAPDARLRGTILHDVFEAFLHRDPDPNDPAAIDLLVETAAARLADAVGWPAMRRSWLAQLRAIAAPFVAGEAGRRAEAQPILEVLEAKADFPVPGTSFVLRGKPDRIDRRDDGDLVIYDYKSGKPPTEPQIAAFDRQLLLLAAMAEHGAFGDLGGRVARVGYIKVGSTYLQADHVPGTGALPDPDGALADLRALIAAYADPAQGYLSRRAMGKLPYSFGYDGLARYGEWTESDRARPERLE